MLYIKIKQSDGNTTSVYRLLCILCMKMKRRFKHDNNT